MNGGPAGGQRTCPSRSAAHGTHQPAAAGLPPGGRCHLEPWSAPPRSGTRPRPGPARRAPPGGLAGRRRVQQASQASETGSRPAQGHHEGRAGIRRAGSPAGFWPACPGVSRAPVRRGVTVLRCCCCIFVIFGSRPGCLRISYGNPRSSRVGHLSSLGSRTEPDRSSAASPAAAAGRRRVSEPATSGLESRGTTGGPRHARPARGESARCRRVVGRLPQPEPVS